MLCVQIAFVLPLLICVLSFPSGSDQSYVCVGRGMSGAAHRLWVSRMVVDRRIKSQRGQDRVT